MEKIRIKLKTDKAGEIFPRSLTKSELRQLQIVEKTIQLCAKDGAEALSYERIAKACGVSRHLVIHYFPNREALVEQVTEYVWASLKHEILVKVDAVAGSKEKLEAYISANLNWMRSNTDLAIFFLLFLHYASTKTLFKKSSSHLFKLGQDRILGILEIGIKEGIFVGIDNPAVEAKMIQIEILGHVVSSISEFCLIDFKDLESALKNNILSRLTIQNLKKLKKKKPNLSQ